MVLIIKGVIGAIITMLISSVAQTRFFYISALFPLFPTFIILSHVMTYKEFGVLGMRTTALFGLFSLIPCFFYLTSILILSKYISFVASTGIALAVWLSSATLLCLLWGHFNMGRLL